MKSLILVLFMVISMGLQAQEVIAPLLNGISLNSYKIAPSKSVRATLPFIDDFSQTAPNPNASLWDGRGIYINNNFPIDPITYGVATLDGLNSKGQPYNPSGFPTKFFGDSLISKAINLSTYNAADSIYLSFFYQPQGNGFAPENNDSLYLLFLGSNNTWVRVWAMNGSATKNFEQILIPVTSSFFLHNNFKFCFTSTVTPNTNDDVWNIDYVKLAANRNSNDKDIKDIALTQIPNKLLQGYTSKPVKHIINADIETFCGTNVQNNYNLLNINTKAFFIAKNIGTNTVIQQDSLPFSLPAGDNLSIIVPGITSPIPNVNKFNLAYTFYIQSANTQDRKQNDTVIGETELYNYFAYDDGSAEKSYYLLGVPSVPISTAIKFDLQVADTVQGLAIKFGQQTPTGVGKPFTITLYSKLDSTTATQQVIYKQDFYSVTYQDTINGFSYYKFDVPQFMQPNTYYIGTSQQPFTGADTLYFGLDVNTATADKNFFYNVDSRWQKSIVSGTVMFRPLVGSGSFYTTAIATPNKETLTVYPNPTTNNLYFTNVKNAPYTIFDNRGQVKQQSIMQNNLVSVKQLQPGNYIISITEKNKQRQQKFTKQ